MGVYWLANIVPLFTSRSFAVGLLQAGFCQELTCVSAGGVLPLLNLRQPL